MSDSAESGTTAKSGTDQSNENDSTGPITTVSTTTQQVANTEGSPTTTRPNEQQPQQQPRSSIISILSRVLYNLVIIYCFSRFFFGPKTAVDKTKVGTIQDGKQAVAASNLYERGFPLDLYVYVSEDSYEPDFFNPKELKWVQKNIIYDDWTQGPNKDSTFTHELDLDLSLKVQRNGSLWLHSYFVRSGFIPYEKDREAKDFSPTYTIHRKKQLNRYKKRKYKKTSNLITGKTDKSEEEQEKIKNKIEAEIISHWHPNLTINMVYDFTRWTPGSVPAPLNEYLDFDPTTNRYNPIIYMNDYWNLLWDYQPINETVKTVHLSLTYRPLSLFKWQLYAAQQMRNQWSSMLGTDAIESEEDQDYIKQALLDTSPILLGLTILVSIAHSVTEFMAFKNDIQFWKDRKSLEGLSVRSVFYNLFSSFVVLLYVFDNDTNTLIRISIGIGLLIELWKIPKVVNIKIDRQNKIFGIFPRITFEDKGSYVESSTRQYDMMAYKYLSWVIFPLFIAYGIYSLIYNEHKGWYSFTLNMTYGFLLAFGFIMMTPQLFINYKLKSVAHLPWRMLTYKFINTFIDDIFAFVIKMPWLYRIGCFRDDIVFLIYLYQRWIYRVDPKRANEYGISGDDIKEFEEKKKAVSSSSTSPEPLTEPPVSGSVKPSQTKKQNKKSIKEKKNE